METNTVSKEFPNQSLTERAVKSKMRLKKRLGFGFKIKKRKAALSNYDWAQQLADELHKPIKRKFKTKGYCKSH